MTNFLIAALLVLHFWPGNAELGEEEEISQFLYDYASRFRDYIYATDYYYTDNTTVIPTVITYEVFTDSDSDLDSDFDSDLDSDLDWDSAASSPQCHLPLVTLLSLLGFLL